MTTLKVALIGDKDTGKTTYLKRLLTGKFNEDYIPTLGIELYELKFNTNHGEYNINIWDAAGNEEFSGLKNGCYLNANACIAFYTKDSDHKKTDELVNNFLKLNPKAKLVIVWSKCDLSEESSYFLEVAKIDGVLNEILKEMPNVKLVNVWSKSLLDGSLSETYLKRDHKDSFVYQISSKTLYNQVEPFLRLLKSLFNKPDLVIV